MKFSFYFMFALLLVKQSLCQCGDEDWTCFQLGGNTITLYNQGLMDHRRKEYFEVATSITRLELQEPHEDEPRVYRLRECLYRPDDFVEDDLKMEHRLVCSDPKAPDVTVDVYVSTYKEDKLYERPLQNVAIAEGMAKFLFVVSQRSVAFTGKVKLTWEMRWPTPNTFWEKIEAGINQIQNELIEDEMLFRVTNFGEDFAQNIFHNAVVRVDVRNFQGVDLCNTASDCPLDMKRAMTAKVTPINYVIHHYVGKTFKIPEGVVIDYEWQGITPVMKIDPTVSIEKGRLVSGHLNVKSLVISLVSIFSFIGAAVLIGLCSIIVLILYKTKKNKDNTKTLKPAPIPPEKLYQHQSSERFPVNPDAEEFEKMKPEMPHGKAANVSNDTTTTHFGEYPAISLPSVTLIGASEDPERPPVRTSSVERLAVENISSKSGQKMRNKVLQGYRSLKVDDAHDDNMEDFDHEIHEEPEEDENDKKLSPVVFVTINNRL